MYLCNIHRLRDFSFTSWASCEARKWLFKLWAMIYFARPCNPQYNGPSPINRSYNTRNGPAAFCGPPASARDHVTRTCSKQHRCFGQFARLWFLSLRGAFQNRTCHHPIPMDATAGRLDLWTDKLSKKVTRGGAGFSLGYALFWISRSVAAAAALF